MPTINTSLAIIGAQLDERGANAFADVLGRWDGYSMMVGHSPDNQVLPVERSITYKSHPSRHECNAKCMGGKINGTCECSCGGRNHGIRGA